MDQKIRLGIIGNGNQVRRHYVTFLCDQAKLPCPVEVAWVSGCRCAAGQEFDQCPFRSSNIPPGLKLGFSTAPCTMSGGNTESWRGHVHDGSVDAVLVSLPHHLHLDPVRAFLERGVAVAVDKPPVVRTADARALVEFAEAHKIPFVTLAQRRFEGVYLAMAEKIRNGAMGDIALINLLFVHGWTPTPGNWRAQQSLAGGGVLIDSVFNCLDVLLWLLRQSNPDTKARRVSAHWSPQNRADPDTVELRITVGVEFDTGCLLSIAAASTALSRDNVDENIKIFGSKGVLRYQRDVFSRANMAAGQLTYQCKDRPDVAEVLMAAGQGVGDRTAPFKDFLECVRDRGRVPISPARDSIEVLEIIEQAYQSAQAGGIHVLLP